MRSPPDQAVLTLLDGRDPVSIWTTSVTLFEIRSGIERLSQSRRRSELEEGFRRAFGQMFAGRLLSFDLDAADKAAVLAADRVRRGEIVEMRDTMIAGIVMTQGAEFATRNIRHFRDLDVTLTNPWSA